MLLHLLLLLLQPGRLKCRVDVDARHVRSDDVASVDAHVTGKTLVERAAAACDVTTGFTVYGKAAAGIGRRRLNICCWIPFGVASD